VLNFGAISSEALIPADLDDCYWGVIEAKLLEGKESDEPFGDDIAGYVGVLLSEEGVLTPPAVLGFARTDPAEQANAQDNLSTLDESYFRVNWEKRQEAKGQLEAYGTARLHDLFQQLGAVPIGRKNVAWLKKQSKLLPPLTAAREPAVEGA